jgi:hypothetical protein
MPTNPSPSPAEVVAALQRGGIVEALKLVLAAKGASSSGRRSTAGKRLIQSSLSRPCVTKAR